MTHCDITHDKNFLDKKSDFPMLNDGKVYLDSASTSFMPSVVLNSISEYISHHTSNYNRGNNDLVLYTNAKVDETRQKVAQFINCDNKEVIFTSGATAASYLIANEIAINMLNTGDEILLCKMDHSSTINPWIRLQNTLNRFGIQITIKEILIDRMGDYDEDDLINKINDNTKFIILTHIHNVYGLEMGIIELSQRIRAKNPTAKIVLDASQSIGHINVNVKELNVDYLYFSGHKMLAPTGIGVLYTKGENYSKYETGTPNILGIVGLGKAIDYIQKLEINNIESHIFYLTRYLYKQLLTIDGIEFNKGIDVCKCCIGYGIISFKHNKISSEEINEILNYYKIYIRSNHFCQDGQDEFMRISLHIYNTKNDIDKFIKALKAIIND